MSVLEQKVKRSLKIEVGALTRSRVRDMRAKEKDTSLSIDPLMLMLLSWRSVRPDTRMKSVFYPKTLTGQDSLARQDKPNTFVSHSMVCRAEMTRVRRPEVECKRRSNSSELQSE